MTIPEIYQGDYRGNKYLGKLVSMFVPGHFLILSQLGKWYEANQYHKFNPRDILILKDRQMLGHGIRPVALVEDYQMYESSRNPFGCEGFYTLTISRDVQGDFLKWMRENTIPQSVERITERNLVYKWNVENRFKRVRVASVEQALELYRSREINEKMRKFSPRIKIIGLAPGDKTRKVSFGSGYSLPLNDE